MNQVNITILGAGIAGLFAAIALHRKNFNVTVYERNSNAKTIGAGLVLWPNVNHILQQLKLFDDIKSNGFTLNSMQRLTDSGEFLNNISFESEESKLTDRNYAITRKALHEILIHHIQHYKIKINYEHCVSKIESQSHNNTLVHFDNGKTINADIIIGADGRLNSLARKYVIGDNKPIYQGYVNWIGIFHNQSGFEFDRTILDYWGCGERFGIVPLSTNSAYWAGCKTLPEGLGEPVTGNKKTLLSIFKQWPDQIKSIIQITSDHNIKRLEVYDHDVINCWHRDNICLIGDAAHAVLPTSGQGACQAIEDAYYLAEQLSQTDNAVKQDYQVVFEQFYQARSKITNAISHNARILTQSIFNTNIEDCNKRNKKLQKSS